LSLKKIVPDEVLGPGELTIGPLVYLLESAKLKQVSLMDLCGLDGATTFTKFFEDTNQGSLSILQ
jgi:hypothetical protein